MNKRKLIAKPAAKTKNPSVSANNEATSLNIPEELKLLNEWQTRLGLKDWLIMLETHVKPDDLDVINADGCVTFEESVKSARIQIVDPDIKPALEKGEKLIELRPFDFEEVLVHELLHIKFCLLQHGDDWENKLQLRILHQILDDIARALVSAKRYDKA